MKHLELNTKMWVSSWIHKPRIFNKYNFLCCNKNYQKKFNGNLKKQFFNTYKFSSHDTNKCISFLQKDVYPYEYIHDWDNETSLTEKEDYYRNLNMDDITDAD